MEFLYIFLGLMALVIVVDFAVKPFVRSKDISTLLNEISSLYNLTLTKVKHKDYHYILENDKAIFYIRILDVNIPSCITVNNKTTWSLTWGGPKNNPGRRYPNQRYVNELIEFLKDEYKSEKRVVKIVLVYKRAEQILKYINESELKEITVKDYAYGIKVINYTSFKESFEEIKSEVLV